MTLDAQHLLRCRPHRVALNCDSSKLAVVDFGGSFSVLDMHVNKPPENASIAAGGGGGGAASGGAGGRGRLTLPGGGGLSKLGITGEHLAMERKVGGHTG